MLILDDTEIRELHTTAVSTNLHERRGALMAGIASGVVASLPVTARPGDQVLLDLDALNKTRTISGTPPLRTWLANAAHLTQDRVEGAIFARYRDRLPAAGPAPQGVAAAAPGRPGAATPARLLDALGQLLPAQFDTLVFKLAIPAAYLSGATAPQAQRGIEVLRWAQQQEGRLADVARVLAEVTSAGKGAP